MKKEMFLKIICIVIIVLVGVQCAIALPGAATLSPKAKLLVSYQTIGSGLALILCAASLILGWKKDADEKRRNNFLTLAAMGIVVWLAVLLTGLAMDRLFL